MIRNKLFAAILSIGAWKSAMPALEHVHITPTAVRVTDLYLEVAYAPPSGTTLVDGSIGVPTKWLLERVRKAGTGRSALPLALGHGPVQDPREPGGVGVEITATVGTTRFSTRGLDGHDMPERPVASPDAAEVELAVADFAKGGAVDQVLPFVSTDETRPHINSVLLATGEAVGLDGHSLLQKPLTKGPPSPVLLPRQAALAIRRMMDHTDVERLVLTIDMTRAWLVATCRDGAEWTVSFKIIDAAYPPYREVGERMASAAGTVVATVDTAELRALMAPLGGCQVAIFADGGLVAWPCGGDEEIAMSLDAYPSDYPITVVGSDMLALVLKGVKARAMQVEVCGPWKDRGSEIRVDGRVMMPVRIHRDVQPAFPDDWRDGLPLWVRDRMAVELGLAEREPAPDRAALHDKLLAEALADEHKRGHIPDLFGSADEMRTAIANLGTETAAAALRNAVVVNRRDGTFLAMPGAKVKPYPYPVLHLGPPTKQDQRAVRQTGMLYPVDAWAPPPSTQAANETSPTVVAAEADAAAPALMPAETVSAAPEPPAAAPVAAREPASRAPRRRRASAAAPAAPTPVEPAAAAPPPVTPEVEAPASELAAAPEPVVAPEPAAAPELATAPELAVALPTAPAASTGPLSAAQRAWLTRRANGWKPTRAAGVAAAPRAAIASSPVAEGSTLSPAQRAWVTRRAKQAAGGAPATAAPCA